MRRAAKVDANQAAVIAALRAIGASVQPTHQLGQGAPDLAVGRGGINWWLEVKDGNKPPSARKLTPDEQAWHQAWRGSVHVVTSPLDAVALILGQT